MINYLKKKKNIINFYFDFCLFFKFLILKMFFNNYFFLFYLFFLLILLNNNINATFTPHFSNWLAQNFGDDIRNHLER